MSLTHAIDAMRHTLGEAIAQEDWQRARRYIDRLMGIVLDSLVRGDPIAIRLAGNALQQAGTRIELLADLPMKLDKVALAWQLRADAGTAALAARVRPMLPTPAADAEAAGDVAGQLLAELDKANGPISNTDLANRTGRDPAVISRVLKRLEMQGRVQRWRGVSGRRLNVRTAPREESPEGEVNCQSIAGQRSPQMPGVEAVSNPVGSEARLHGKIPSASLHQAQKIVPMDKMQYMQNRQWTDPSRSSRLEEVGAKGGLLFGQDCLEEVPKSFTLEQHASGHQRRTHMQTLPRMSQFDWMPNRLKNEQIQVSRGTMSGDLE